MPSVVVLTCTPEVSSIQSRIQLLCLPAHLRSLATPARPSSSLRPQLDHLVCYRYAIFGLDRGNPVLVVSFLPTCQVPDVHIRISEKVVDPRFLHVFDGDTKLFVTDLSFFTPITLKIVYCNLTIIVPPWETSF